MHDHAHHHANEGATTVPSEYQASITSKRTDLTDLRACFAEFMSHYSARAVMLAFVVALALRIVVGEWSYHDAIVVLLLIAAQPFVEWFIHKYLLHLKPFEFRGRKLDLYAASQHRRHHKAPSKLNRVVLKPPEVVSSIISIAITASPIVAAITALTGTAFLPTALTAIAFSYVGLFRYEWTHFLIHTPYVPKTRFYRSVWRSHRLHHFKHEDYWLGVTSNFSDRVLHTFPEQTAVKRSPTARTLGVDVAD